MLNQSKTEIPSQNTLIGEATCVRGTLTGSTDLIVQGRVEGQIHTEGNVVVEQTGVVKANIVGATVIVKGVVVGDIAAYQSIQLETEGRVVGNVNAPRFSMAEGALYRGHVETDESVSRDTIEDGDKIAIQPLAIKSPVVTYQHPAVHPPAMPSKTPSRRTSSIPRSGSAMPMPPPPPTRVTFKPIESKAPRQVRIQPPMPPVPPPPPAPFQAMLLHDENVLPGIPEEDLVPAPATISKRKGAIKSKKQS